MPTLQIRVKLGSTNIENNPNAVDPHIMASTYDGRIRVPINMPANHLNVGRLILSSCSLESRYRGTGTIAAPKLPENAGFFVEIPWIQSGVVGQNQDDGQNIADAIYLPQGSYTLVGKDCVTCNNESPALEYSVINNHIPPQFYLHIYPSHVSDNGLREFTADLMMALRYIEINLYFSYM